ncbi:lysosome-associated membrane glycoprotein 1-like [Leptopilina heterotoma]|uniref:lysosome-associated membrane glycoprotein 1-like n=1 Tax=Leptopilina heterotoma TaxID=63436 RepID=UPI001CA99D63|nr:lysosome-associated membrane glycoprotein 1-like [Leptopilina heterotoma]
MLRKILILLCSAAIFVSAVNETVGETKPNSVPETKSLNEEIEHAHTTSKTTTVTTPTTTTSTTPKTTTTEKTTTTSTTTPAPTPPPTTTTTTEKPTTVGPTTTTPVPVPTDKKWSLNATNETCIVIQMAAQFEITYPLNKTAHFTQKLNLPANDAVVNGSCGDKEQIIILSWNSTKGSINDSFSLHFLKDEKNKKYTLHHMELVILPQELPKYNSTSNQTLKFVHETDEIPTGLGNSYRCLKETSFKMTMAGTNDTTAVVKVNDVQFQAFKTDKNTSFGLAEDCAFDTPDVVPIAVGCALAALVVIVLVAYLIGRRRAQARGYLSM